MALFFKILKIPGAGKDVEQPELSYIVVEMPNGTVTLENGLSVSYNYTYIYHTT